MCKLPVAAQGITARVDRKAHRVGLNEKSKEHIEG